MRIQSMTLQIPLLRLQCHNKNSYSNETHAHAVLFEICNHQTTDRVSCLLNSGGVRMYSEHTSTTRLMGSSPTSPTLI